ncbi:MAG: alpha/beta hydrolase [Salinivirgaceae bacterium]|nr:alpha/beta hydrolase [Salinivirgaceae bacterium]
MRVNLLVVLMALAISAGAQTKTINLWPDGAIPGGTGLELEPERGEEGWTWERNITMPTLTIYPAPADRNTHTAVLVIPGGGYWALAVEHEGHEVAQWLNSIGITAFVLKHRLPNDITMVPEVKKIAPLQDAQRAMRLIREMSDSLGFDTHRVGAIGFSSGGHLVTSLSDHHSEELYKSDYTNACPNFQILIYPVLTLEDELTHKGSQTSLLGDNPTEADLDYFASYKHVGKTTPITFMVHSFDDNTVSYEGTMLYAKAMAENNRQCEVHLYPRGSHGYGLRNKPTTESHWTQACYYWLEMNGFLH